MNDLYDAARSRFISATFNWPMRTVKLAAFAIDYVFDKTDVTLSDIDTPAAISLPLTGQVVSPGGYAKADAALFATPAAGVTWKFFVLVDVSGVADADGKLIAYYDEGFVLPYETNGQDELVIPDWEAERGWFRP